MKDTLIGQRFDRLSVIEKIGARSKTNRNVYWLCQCDCGNTVEVAGSRLRSGETRSCGCYRSDLRSEFSNNVVHGQTAGGTIPPEYRSWSGAKQRCFDPENPNYANYGGRGITMCDRWKNSFKAFYEDMGKKPSPQHSIDRIDNNGNYEPGNCKWSTPIEQRHNRRDSPKYASAK